MCSLFTVMGALGDIRPHVQSLLGLIIIETLRSEVMVTLLLLIVSL